MKVGRNKSCPCGSGRKYKKCCLDKQSLLGEPLTEIRIQEIIFEKNKSLFEINEELRGLMDRIINVKIKSPNEKHFFSIFALAKAYKTHFAVLKLCREGFGEDAAILVRSMFDLLITLLYILKDTSDYRIHRYLDYDWIIRNNIHEYAKTKPEMVKMMEERETRLKPTEDSRLEIEKKANEYQNKYNYTKFSWSDKSIRGMAEEAGRLDEYKTVYSLQSQINHSSTRTMNDYIKVNDKGIFVSASASNNWIEESLVAGFDFLCSIAGEYNNLNHLEFDEVINEIIKRWSSEVDKSNKQ